MLSTATNLSIILTSAYFKFCHFHACSLVSLLVFFYCPLVSIHSLFPCSLANLSSLRKSAVMVIVIKVCNTIRNFLYPHMVAIRGFSISNFTWYCSSDCQEVRYSLLCACVSKKGYPPPHKAWRTTWLVHSYSILDCGPEAGCKGVNTWKHLSLTIARISLPCRHLSLPQSVIALLPQSGLLFLSFTGIICSISLWSSLLSSSFFSWCWKLCVPSDEENGYLATASITCFSFSLSLLYAAGVNVILRTLQSFSHRH